MRQRFVNSIFRVWLQMDLTGRSILSLLSGYFRTY
jgi:hypothetical protein